MITRNLRYLAFGMVMFAFVAASILPARAVSLKQNGVIRDESLKVGDIFNGLDEQAAAKVLGPAPMPGQDMTLNARTLMRIAIAMDLPWRPQTHAEQITLRRASTVIEQDTVNVLVKGALAEKGAHGKFQISYDTLPEKIALPEDLAAGIEISDAVFKAGSNRFEVTVNAPSKENSVYESRLSGKIERMIDVPVLTSAISNGHIIGESDIEIVEMKESAVQGGMMVNAKDLIGMTPRKTITPGSPIKLHEVEKPVVVARGDLVTVIFKNGPLFLTAQGKALENGAAGDSVRVVNTGSNQTLQAKVTGSREVTVEGF